jgi:hypothetical protein
LEECRIKLESNVLVSPTGDVPVIEQVLVATIRESAGRGVGSKTIARTVGVDDRERGVDALLRHGAGRESETPWKICCLGV